LNNGIIGFPITNSKSGGQITQECLSFQPDLKKTFYKFSHQHQMPTEQEMKM
jgi:hypothetical protein